MCSLPMQRLGSPVHACTCIWTRMHTLTRVSQLCACTHTHTSTHTHTHTHTHKFTHTHTHLRARGMHAKPGMSNACCCRCARCLHARGGRRLASCSLTSWTPWRLRVAQQGTLVRAQRALIGSGAPAGLRASGQGASPWGAAGLCFSALQSSFCAESARPLRVPWAAPMGWRGCLRVWSVPAALAHMLSGPCSTCSKAWAHAPTQLLELRAHARTLLLLSCVCVPWG